MGQSTEVYECDHGTFCTERCSENWHNENIVGKPDCSTTINDGEASDDHCAQCSTEIIEDILNRGK